MHQLAIVIPYYKIDFFEETLKSVAMQTDRRFTLYIGNDASPYDPLPLIQQYFPEGNYHYFDYKENLGGTNLAAQWERILENVTEEWFQILGDDDMVSENFVEKFYKIVQKANENGNSVLRFSHSWVDKEGICIEKHGSTIGEIMPEDFILKKLKGEIRSSLSENIFKRSQYTKHGFVKLPLAWGTDDLAVLLFAGKKSILYSDAAEVKVRISDMSISGSSKDGEMKGKAINELKHLLATTYRHLLQPKDREKLAQEYLAYCYHKNSRADYSVASIYLSPFKFIALLRTMKKIYTINRNALHQENQD